MTLLKLYTPIRVIMFVSYRRVEASASGSMAYGTLGFLKVLDMLYVNVRGYTIAQITRCMHDAYG